MATRVEFETLGALWRGEEVGAAGGLLNTNGRLQVTWLDGRWKSQLGSYSSRTNDQGELLDPWRVPIQFDLIERTNVRIRSAGPNRSFGNKDDLVVQVSLDGGPAESYGERMR